MTMRDDEIGAEHHEILKLADVKGEARRNEQKIPEQSAEGSEKKRGPSSQAGGSKKDRQQIKQSHRPVTGVSEDRQRQSGDSGSDEKGDAEVAPRHAGQTFLDRVAPRLHRFLSRNHVNVDVPAVAHEPAQRVPLPETCPASAQRFADDDLGNVVLSRNAQKRFSDINSRR